MKECGPGLRLTTRPIPASSIIDAFHDGDQRTQSEACTPGINEWGYANRTVELARLVGQAN